MVSSLGQSGPSALCVYFGFGQVRRGGDEHGDVVGGYFVVEQRLQVEDDLRAVAAVRGEDGPDLEGLLDFVRNAEVHQRELAVGRHERNLARLLEVGEAHAVVERRVVQSDAGLAALDLRLARRLLLLRTQTVVERERAVGHPRKLAVNLDVALNVCMQKLPNGRHRAIHLLHTIHVNLIFVVTDSLTTVI